MKEKADFWAGVSLKALGSKEMFSRKWYLRRERLVLYSASSLIGIVAESVAEVCTFKYEFLQNHIEDLTHHTAHVHNNDIEAAGILSIVFPTVVLFILEAEYFRLLFWPGFRQPKWYIAIKKAATILFTFGMFVTTVVSTVVVARRHAFITGVDHATIKELTTLYFRPPLHYKMWPRNIAWVVLLWIAMVPTLASAVLLLYVPGQERLTESVDEDSFSGANQSTARDTNTLSPEKKKASVSVLERTV